MVNVGIVGLGPDWDLRFRPALQKLRERIAVRALYDPVASRAAQLAAECNTDAVDGLVALSGRSDIQAILLLDAGWPGWESVRLLCAAGKPVFVLSGFSPDQSALRLLHDQATALGQTVMPAFGLRYTPASCRLRELMATRLGPPTAISVEAIQPLAETAPFVGLIDWCRYVVGSSPLRIHADASNGSGDGVGESSIQLEFNNSNDHSVAVCAELKIPVFPQPAARCGFVTDIVSPAGVRATVTCQRGTATLESSTQIVWQDGDESVCETLTSERTEIEVMLDLFCRRVVGGLIPVADISDVLRGARLLEAARNSLQVGAAVEISGVG